MEVQGWHQAIPIPDLSVGRFAMAESEREEYRDVVMLDHNRDDEEEESFIINQHEISNQHADAHPSTLVVIHHNNSHHTMNIYKRW